MEFIRPDGLVDVAKLESDTGRGEAVAGANSQQEGVAAQTDNHAMLRPDCPFLRREACHVKDWRPHRDCPHCSAR